MKTANIDKWLFEKRFLLLATEIGGGKKQGFRKTYTRNEIKNIVENNFDIIEADLIDLKEYKIVTHFERDGKLRLTAEKTSEDISLLPDQLEEFIHDKNLAYALKD